jgi:hypothetical protein
MLLLHLDVKNFIIKRFTQKICLSAILGSLVFSFLMMGINFNRMEMPYNLYLSLVLIPALIAVIVYLGHIMRAILLWNKSFAFNNIFKLIAIGGLLGFSLFLSLGITLPTLNYPR